MQDSDSGTTRLDPPPSPAPLPIHLRWCHFAPAQTTAPAASRHSASLHHRVTTPFPDSCTPITAISVAATDPKRRAAILLPALHSSVFPFLLAPKWHRSQNPRRYQGRRRQGTRLPVLTTQAFPVTAIRASSRHLSQQLNEINKAVSQLSEKQSCHCWRAALACWQPELAGDSVGGWRCPFLGYPDPSSPSARGLASGHMACTPH